MANTISQNAIYIIFSLKEFNDRIGQKQDLITQDIPEIHTKQFSQEDFSLKNMKTIAEIKCIE